MLDMRFIRENTDCVRAGCQAKRCAVDLDALLQLDQKRRTAITEVERLKAEQNKANEDIAATKRAGEDISAAIAEMKEISQKIKKIDTEVGLFDKEIRKILLTVPNIPHNSVPDGDPTANKVVRTWGEPKELMFEGKDHLTIGESIGCINMATAAKISGSGFVVYKGWGARLERALINFMLDLHTKKHGYEEISPPFIVNRNAMTGTGQLPKLEDDMYVTKEDDLFLIPTAEVPVTNIHRNEILDETALPVTYVAYTPCFRKEAGSYGKDTRGLSRVHQFDKVELVKMVKPEDSFNALESLVRDAEAVLQALELPYRVVLLASGDMSFAASKCYDLEVWAPVSKRWFEVSSCSNFCDFQARRADIKYRIAETKKTAYVHTLNGSGVALARIFLAILEQYQTKEGTVETPAALKPYMS